MSENIVIKSDIVFDSSIFRLKKSNKKTWCKLVSYADNGKVILAENWKDLHEGYGKLEKVVAEKDKYYVGIFSNIDYDFYHGIPYESLKTTLKLLGFEQMLTEPIESKFSIGIPNEYSVWCNSHGVLISVETWAKSKDEDNNYNSIMVFIPTGGKFYHKEENTDLGIKCFNQKVISCDVTKSKCATPIHKILSMQGSESFDGAWLDLRNYDDLNKFYGNMEGAIAKSEERIDKCVVAGESFRKKFNLGVRKYIEREDKKY